MGSATHWLPLGLALALVGCDLAQPEEVSRPTDASLPPWPRDASATADGAPADAPVDSPMDEAPADSRDERASTPDAPLAVDGRDSLADLPSETAASSDGGCAAEAGDGCGPAGWVMTDDFEDGAAGWMSTGIIWTVTEDSSAPGTNSVLAPTGPAASSVYYASGAWQDMTAEVRLRLTTLGKPTSANRAELYARYQGSGYLYGIALRADRHVVLRRNAGSLGLAVPVALAEGEWHVLKIRVSGPATAVSVEGYLDDVLLTAVTDSEGSLPSAVGTVGVGIYGETVAVFDDVKVSSP